MKILLVNKFHYFVGGTERYYFSLKRLLEKNGHEVIEFSMKSPNNISSAYEEYFIENIDYNKNMSLAKKIKLSASIIYSTEAKTKFEQLVVRTRPDVVHLNLFQNQISLSILDVCKKYNLPVVYTAHELKMLCPNYKMYNKGKVCEKCYNNTYYHCLFEKCVKESYSKSLVASAEAYFNKFRHSYDIIDYIITPSRFYKKLFLKNGIDENRVKYIPNFLERDYGYLKNSTREKYLYLGRLSEEKGLWTLIEAFSTLNEQLDIVGTGSLYDELLRYIETHHLDNICIKGFFEGDELIKAIASAKALIIPSEWYENSPYSAIEALQLSIPIIGANIGGIPEMISKNGFWFEPGDSDDLRAKIQNMESLTESQYDDLCQDSRKLYDKVFNSEMHYDALTRVYSDAIKRHTSE